MRAADVMRTKADHAAHRRRAPAARNKSAPFLMTMAAPVGIVAEGDLVHRDELGINPPCNWLEALLGIEEGGRFRERMRALRVVSIMTPNPFCVDVQ